MAFRAVMDAMEEAQQLPWNMLAYRQGLSATLGALMLRWWLWWWTLEGEVWLVDWDESNAFCIVPRARLPQVLRVLQPDFGKWAQEHYRQFPVRVVTPAGVTEPFPLHHGGGQGDSGGVALYTLVGVLRTLTHEQLLRSGVDPMTQKAGSYSWEELTYSVPGRPRIPAHELCFSDDRRLMARSATGIVLHLAGRER